MGYFLCSVEAQLFGGRVTGRHPESFARLTRALLGLWISHRLLGGGRLNAPPP